ncbi:MAG: CDP-alcohol phosphatidyltransferase family protein [Provencibacterium sp.]|jgi:cardiolipin synthase|nr:CDP-alcohol phosphatidyltransferase family protein [Provencibacterium sp.]
MRNVPGQLFSIPNLLSMARIAIIPLFIWTYLETGPGGSYLLSSALLIASGLTDMLDGLIARRFNQITDLGKILDPVADKLTQLAILVCLTLRHPHFIFLFLIFALKELLMLTGGLLLLRRHIHPGSAKWFGKIATCFFYISMILVVLFPRLPPQVVDGIVLINLLLSVFALLMYIPVFFMLKKGEAGR